jgi:5-methylcytosine-specific restriction endonuclease McrA
MAYSAQYQSYMQSPAWFAKRRAKIIDADYTCAECGYCALTHPVDIALEVHHKTYARLGNECMSDLEVLCYFCHTRRHWKSE